MWKITTCTKEIYFKSTPLHYPALIRCSQCTDRELNIKSCELFIFIPLATRWWQRWKSSSCPPISCNQAWWSDLCYLPIWKQSGVITTVHFIFKWFLVVNAYTPRSTSLPGNLVLMVEQGSDIGNPAYGQLQKLHKVDARTWSCT